MNHTIRIFPVSHFSTSLRFVLILLFFAIIRPLPAADALRDSVALSAIDSVIRPDAPVCVQPVILENGRLKFPPCPDTAWKQMMVRNQQAPFGRKFLRGGGLVLAMQGFTYGMLFAMPESVSNWDRSQLDHYGQNMKDAFTKPPVVDGDHWYVNYIGHPFQGSYYYNAYRSQGAPFWQCALLATGHSFFWEYFIESGIERPSVQDLVVTPVVGSFMGECFHWATRRMAHNGFKWYEAAAVCIINPMFALNNGFRFAGKPQPRPL